MAGVTDAGFESKSLATIQSDVENAVKAAFGESTPMSGDTNTGVLIGIMSELLSELWDLAEDVYNAGYPDTAGTSDALEGISAITGTLREDPTKSTVSVTLTGTPTTIVPAGTVFSVVGTEARFETIAEATIGGGGTVAVECESEEFGAIVAASGTLTVIETPVSGLTSVTNALDAVLGSAEETLPALRLRRETELRRAGKAAADAIRTDVLTVANVTACTVLENATDATDGNGLPPHSIEVLVLGGTDAAVAAAIWDSKAAGIATFGGETESVTDDSGNAHDVNFSRPDDLEAWLSINLTTNADYPVTGDADVKAAIVAWAEDAATGYAVGADLILSKLYPVILEIAGIDDVVAITSVVQAAGAGTPTHPGDYTAGNKSVDVRELLTFDTSWITIT